MPRLEHLRTSPRFDRSHWPQEWTSSWRIQVLDLFAGRGGTGRALDKVLPQRMYLGVDHEDYSNEYPGQFTVADLIDPENRPFNGVTADVVWVSWPCTAYAEPSAVEYGSAEAALEENPESPTSSGNGSSRSAQTTSSRMCRTPPTTAIWTQTSS